MSGTGAQGGSHGQALANVDGLLIEGRRDVGFGTVVEVTPESAGWRYVGFEALRLQPGDAVERSYPGREVCLVIIEGSCGVRSAHGQWSDLGRRATPFEGLPDAVYLPPGTTVAIEAGVEGVEVGIGSAPAMRGAQARVLPGEAIEVEVRGHGSLERIIHPILMEGQEAESLLICEVITPAGHWSSYPPHKHDRDALPEESLLEETYYHRIDPPGGFGLQRVYSDDGSLDVSVAFGDRDLVLTPRGYHTVSAPPGYRLYYLNVMAGPTRAWAVANDPEHEWTLGSGGAG